MQTAAAISIENATLSYQDHVLFNQLTLSIPANKITCLLGKSGVGKSTLLRLIAGLVATDDTTNFRGKITSVNQIAYMAQTDLLLPWLNALDNALLGYRLRNKVTTACISRAKNLFAQMELTHAENKLPRELSGGMRQRVALIRTLLEDRPIVLMDEPFSHLDAITRFQLQNLTVAFLRGKTVLLVTHDPMEALRIADDIIVLGGGPAKITSTLCLTTPTPRKLNDAEILQYQEELFAELLKN